MVFAVTIIALTFTASVTGRFVRQLASSTLDITVDRACIAPIPVFETLVGQANHKFLSCLKSCPRQRMRP